MDVSTLVQAVIVYMKDHYPTTPEQFNFQAELKAASHWCWRDDEKALNPGPHDDLRVKFAANETLNKWLSELGKMRKSLSAKGKRSSPVKAKGENKVSGPSQDGVNKRISGESIIFSLSGTRKKIPDISSR